MAWEFRAAPSAEVAVAAREEELHVRWNSEVVQRREGLRLHRPRRREQGRLRPLLRDRVVRVQVPRGEPAGELHRVAGPEGHAGRLGPHPLTGRGPGASSGRALASWLPRPVQTEYVRCPGDSSPRTPAKRLPWRSVRRRPRAKKVSL